MMKILTFILFTCICFAQQDIYITNFRDGSNIRLSGFSQSTDSMSSTQYKRLEDSTIVGNGYGLDRVVENHTHTLTVDTTNEIATLFDVSQKQNLGTYLIPSDSTANRTFSDLKYQAKYANITDTAKYVENADTTNLHYVKFSQKQATIPNITDTAKYVENADTTNLHYVKLAGKVSTSDTTGRWAPAGNYSGAGFTYVKRTADTTNSVATPVNLGNMRFNVTSGTYYYFKFLIQYQSSASTTGLKLTITYPAVTTSAAVATINGLAADGNSHDFTGAITSSGDVVTSTAVVAQNVTYIAILEGTMLPSASGAVQLQWSPETANAATIKAGTMLMYQSY